MPDITFTITDSQLAKIQSVFNEWKSWQVATLDEQSHDPRLTVEQHAGIAAAISEVQAMTLKPWVWKMLVATLKGQDRQRLNTMADRAARAEKSAQLAARETELVELA